LPIDFCLFSLIAADYFAIIIADAAATALSPCRLPAATPFLRHYCQIFLR
jgi:hypothetical protein